MPLHDGDPAPDLLCAADDGTVFHLASHHERTHVILFLGSIEDEASRRELDDFSRTAVDMRAKGVEVVAVLPDPIERLRIFQHEDMVPVRLLSDPDGTAARTWCVTETIEEAGIGAPHAGAIRCTFVVDRGGIVRRVFPVPNPEGHAENVDRVIALDPARP